MQRAVQATLDWNPTISETIRQFNECCNYFLELGFVTRATSKYQLQKLGYYQARRLLPSLPSSLVQGARDCAIDMLKRERRKRWHKKPVKKPFSSIRYNLRVFKPYLERGMISIATIEGRQKVRLKIPEYFKKYLHGYVKSMRLRIKRGRILADLIVELPDPEPITNKNVLGIDRGILNVATLSTGQFFNSKRIRAIRGRYAYIRSRLQSAGTRSAKRHLKRLSGRERRFQTDVNHQIAKKIAAMDYGVFALERLEIRKTKRNGRRFNGMLGRWAYAQNAKFLEYKAQDRGKAVIYVDARCTSKICSRCGNKGSREGLSFKCSSCGYRLNADLNAARNIALRARMLLEQAVVNQPIVAYISTAASHLLK